MLKSEEINRKFTWSKLISDYEIETDTGFVDVSAIHKTIPYLRYVIKTEHNTLECADNHILFTDGMKEIFAKELKAGDMIATNNGYEKVIDVINTGEYEEMFDIELSEDSNHRYFTNNILSHNTFLAKRLAYELFGSETALVRFDMSEYPDKSAVNKLIGSNPGYIGYEEGGQLTEAIKNKKYCVLLLDEIEKADPEIYNIFLQVLDEGFLTDNSGQKVDFRNVIVLFTSNTGAADASKFKHSIGFTDDTDANQKRILTKSLKDKFPPEFLNRLDNVIYFNPLTEDNLKEIIKLELDKTRKRIEDIGYKFEYTNDTVNTIFDIVSEEKEYGARPIMRAIQTNVEDKITDMLLEKDYEKDYVFKI